MNKPWNMKMIRETFVLVICLQGIAFCSYHEEEAIFDKITKNINKYVRPFLTTKRPLDVQFDAKLKSINDLSVKKQILDLDVFVTFVWDDPRLRWNKTSYNNTDRVLLPSDLIWTPDVMLYNKANKIARQHTDIYTSKIIVLHDGKCIWSNLVNLKIGCSLDITWFPLDKQKCSLSFGSWSYSESQLLLSFSSAPPVPNSADKSPHAGFKGQFQIDSGEWVIDSIVRASEPIDFSCCPEPFSSIKYTFELSRESLYYFMYILLPLCSLAFLFLLVFHIPPDSGERMCFGVTILLSITVYLLVISEKLPEKSNETPFLGVCFIAIFYILILALFTAAGTTIFSRRKNKPPEWLLRLTVTPCCRHNKKSGNGSGGGALVECTVMPNAHKLPITNNNADDERNSIKGRSIGNDEVSFQSKCDDNADYTDDWVKISRDIDKKLFVAFSLLMVAVPIVLYFYLPKTGMA